MVGDEDGWTWEFTAERISAAMADRRPGNPYASILADHFFLQRSGELVTKFGLNAENEIIHTLAFLAGAMVCILSLCFPLYCTLISFNGLSALEMEYV